MSIPEFLPIELVFNPNWWYHAANISFDEPFYFEADTRIKNDVIMRQTLHQRFGDIGLGEADPQPRPIVGSLHVAGGFVIPALFGSEITFEPNAAPQPNPLNLSVEQIDQLAYPDFRETWPMTQLIADMDALEKEYGYLIGDFNTDGLLNAAYHLYGQQMFIDFYEAPQRLQRLFDIIGRVIVDVALYVRERTGSCSISVNRMVARVDPAMFLHANCSVQMISPKSYRDIHFEAELNMARRIQPFGIHHCGNNLHRIAPEYAGLPAGYYEVGWGSDVAECRQSLPGAFLNLRLNPVRILQCTPQEIAQDTEKLLLAAGPLAQAGVCCINMDHDTPDDNIFAMAEVVERFRRYGA